MALILAIESSCDETAVAVIKDGELLSNNLRISGNKDIGGKYKMNINLRHKDRLFIFLFGNEAHKDWTLNLYNAVNNSNYDDPEAISFNTLDDFLYMGMKNDISFIINGQINLFEHQSTINPNMPLRQFLYLAHIYEAHVSFQFLYW